MYENLMRVEWWPPCESEIEEHGQMALVEVERYEDDTNRIAIHTFVDGRGSLSSYYLDREEARRFALRLLVAAEV